MMKHRSTYGIGFVNFILLGKSKTIVFVQNNGSYIYTTFLVFILNECIRKRNRKMIECRHCMMRQAQRGVRD